VVFLLGILPPGNALSLYTDTSVSQRSKSAYAFVPHSQFDLALDVAIACTAVGLKPISIVLVQTDWLKTLAARSEAARSWQCIMYSSIISWCILLFHGLFDRANAIGRLEKSLVHTLDRHCVRVTGHE